MDNVDVANLIHAIQVKLNEFCLQLCYFFYPLVDSKCTFETFQKCIGTEMKHLKSTWMI